MVLSVCDGDVAVHGVDGVHHQASWFSWWYKFNMRVQGVLLFAHGDASEVMLPSSEVGLGFSRISDESLVDYH